jgi:glycosyltransferase involved in cell wall biosynthesis
VRVLHISPYYEDAWAYGGIPRVVGLVTRTLAARGHAVTVCTTDARDATSRLPRARPDGGERGGVTVEVFRNLSNRLAYHRQFFVPRGLGAWLARHAREFDVAHVHGCHHLPGVVAARHARAAGVPYVLSPHGTAPRIERRRLAKLLFDTTVGRGVLERAEHVVAVSDAEARALAALGVPPARVAVIPNPVDAAEASAIERGRLRSRTGLGARTIVLYLGTLTPRKRVDLLVDAFARLRDSDAVLVVAGNDLGAGAAIRSHVVRQGLQHRVVFTGLLRGRERLHALADADVVAYPGSDEVFGLVLVEALLCGVPVVAADDSGAAEVVARTGGGRVVRHGDPTDLANALGDILADRRRWRASAVRAGQRAASLFAPASVSARIEAVYATVCGASAGTTP